MGGMKEQEDTPLVAIVSTHLDDAVFSVGAGMAALAKKGVEVRLVTVLAGDPDSEEPAGPWDRSTGFQTSGEAARVRREEDRRACEILGVTPIWLPYCDEQYARGGSDEVIKESLRSHLAGATTVLVAGFPLLQRDHELVTKITLSLGLRDVLLGLYAEQPYSIGYGAPSYPRQAEEAVAPSSSWMPLPARAADRSAKRLAREAYRSQLARIARTYGRPWPALQKQMERMESGMGGELVAWFSYDGQVPVPAAPPNWAIGKAGTALPAQSYKDWIPKPVRRALGSIRRWSRPSPRIERVRFGSLRRLEPVSRQWGYDRGRPVDRYYIEEFLAGYAGDIRGRVLEVADDAYTRRFGNDVVQVDVLHVVPGNPKATIIADLAAGHEIPSDTFDCVVLTQTLQFIYRVQEAIGTIHRILKPGGVVLATMPGISQISRLDMEQWGDYWRFTSRSAQQLFREFFDDHAVSVTTYGNVLSATAFLHGLADRELTREELENWDQDYELVIGVRAVKQKQLAQEPGTPG
jgi:LmbE family N-acetylglucosaminyl deacetylase/SAM-dependent methyltransferase